MEKVKTFDEKRNEHLGMTDGEEYDLKTDVLFDIQDKINEIIDWINKDGNNN